ncbi:hypothetical protein I317_03825 [Kwoniella heveanensis CBS 569]|nr:hypothetical protein I317_03825 [Kwoniella heveanensis CBS 569]
MVAVKNSATADGNSHAPTSALGSGSGKGAAAGGAGAGGGTPKATRSRNGCLVCRSRRLKCDLEKPECRRCINYGAECVYPEKKAFDPNLIAEKLARRHRSTTTPSHQTTDQPQASIKPELQSFPSSSSQVQSPFAMPTFPSPNGPLQQSHGSPLVTNHTVDPLTRQGSGSGTGAWVARPPALVQQMDTVELLMALCRDTRMGQFFGGPLDPPEFLRATFPVEEDLRCFHHCVTYSLSILVTEEDRNPWVDHVTRLFLFPSEDAPLSCEALKQGMLAMGAIHLSSLEARGTVTGSTHGTSRDLGLKYRWEAVKLLRQAKSRPSELESDAFLAAAIMLCCDDVLGANPHWREVLRLALLAVRRRGGCEKILFPEDGDASLDPSLMPLRRCLIETLVIALSITASLVTGEPTVVLTESASWWERLCRPDASDPHSFEYTTGWHRSVPPIWARVITLLFESHHLERQALLDPDFSLTEPITLISSIHPSSASRRWSELSGNVTRLEADMKRWIEDVLPTLTRKRTRDGSLAMWHAMYIMVLKDLTKRPRSDPELQSSALAVLDVCAQVGDKVEWMNFPLLIACSALVDPTQRQRARDILRWFKVQCCYEIDVVESVIEECWKRIDDGMDEEACSWREILLEMGCSVLIG